MQELLNRCFMNAELLNEERLNEELLNANFCRMQSAECGDIQ